MAYANGPRIVTDGLILCLDAANTKSYPGSGTAWNDLSGSSYNGTLYNSPAFSSANKGIINFDGTDDHCPLDTTTSSEIRNISTPYTLMAWIRPHTQHTGAIVGAYSCSGTTMGIYFRVYSNSGNLRAQAFYTTSTGGFGARENYTTVATDTWHQLSVVVTGTTSAAYMKIYVNNIPSSNYSIGAIMALNTVGWRIGRANCGGDYFNGEIGRVSMYNRDFSASEIEHNYNALKGRYGL